MADHPADPLRISVGSVVAITDVSGSILSEQRYLPFGQVREDAGTIAQTDFGYTGQRAFEDMGLMDYKARFYNAALGRFVQPDTLISELANPQSLNRFNYVLNNPILYNDPSGHHDECSAMEECKNDSYYAGYYTSHLKQEDRETVEELMDENHFLDPIKVWVSGGLISSAVGDVLGLVLPSSILPGRPQVQGSNGNKDLLGSPDCKGCGYRNSWYSQASGKWSDYISPGRRDLVQNAFGGKPRAVITRNPITVYHYSTSSPTGKMEWFTTNSRLTPDQARSQLALPDKNAALVVTSVSIPEGTTILIGPVGAQTSTPGFGDYATGGGFQIYIPGGALP